MFFFFTFENLNGLTLCSTVFVVIDRIGSILISTLVKELPDFAATLTLIAAFCRPGESLVQTLHRHINKQTYRQTDGQATILKLVLQFDVDQEHKKLKGSLSLPSRCRKRSEKVNMLLLLP